MTDATTAVGGLATPPAAPDAATTPPPDTTQQVQPGDQAIPPAEEFEDFEWEGKPVKLPKGMKDGYLRQDDYTRKTQEVSTRRRELDERQARLEQQSKATDVELNDRAQLQFINSRLQQIEAMSWDQWTVLDAEDPARADQLRKYQQFAQSERAKLEGRISDASKKRTEAAQSETTKRAQETFDWAQKNIKGWNQDVDTKVFAFAQAEGYTPEELTSRMSPRFYALLHKAMIGEATLKRSTAPGVSAPTPPSPTVVGGKTNPPASFDPAKSDMEDYVRARKAQIAAKR